MQNLSQEIELTSIICTAIAIVVTILRLFVRRASIWVDDVCAFIAMMFLCAQMGTVLRLAAFSNAFARYYLFMGTFYGTIWFARLSILFSIIRISNTKRFRQLMSCFAIVFILTLATLMGQVFWVCQPQRNHDSCKPTKQIAIFQLVSAVVADSILLLSPLHLFAIIQDRGLRYRLIIIFSTCISTTAVSLVHATLILLSQGPSTVIAAVVETSVSLIVASIPIIANIFARLGRRYESKSSNTSTDVPISMGSARNINADESMITFEPSPAQSTSGLIHKGPLEAWRKVGIEVVRVPNAHMIP